MSEEKKSFAKKEITNELLAELISADRSFEITGLDVDGSMTEMVEAVETAIERQHKTCRVYTAGRSAAVAAAAIPTGVTQVTGVAAAIGIGLHNFATYNPDYEIAKHLLDIKLSVNKKEVTLENGKKKSRWSFLGDIVIAGAGALADSVASAAEKSAKQNGREQEFREKKEALDTSRRQAKQTFMRLTGKGDKKQ